MLAVKSSVGVTLRTESEVSVGQKGQMSSKN